MAEALIKYETIDRSQIDEIMQGKKPTPPADWNDDDHSGKDGGGSGEATTTEDPEAKEGEIVNAKPASSH